METGPLWSAAVWLYDASREIGQLAINIEKVPIIGEYLSKPFWWVSWCLELTAYWLEEADTWVTTLNISTWVPNIIDWIMDTLEPEPYIRMFYQGHFVAWIMHRLGFYTADCFDFEASPEAFIIWKISQWFPDLALIWGNPFGWIKEKIIEWVPALEYFFEDPVRWVLYMLGVPWGDTITWRYHLFGYLLYASGESRLDSLWWDRYPKYWIRAKVLERWDFLDDLLLDPVGWFWKEFTEAVDRYIDVNIDWLVRTAARVLNTIWQTRL